MLVRRTMRAVSANLTALKVAGKKNMVTAAIVRITVLSREVIMAKSVDVFASC